MARKKRRARAAVKTIRKRRRRRRLVGIALLKELTNPYKIEA